MNDGTGLADALLGLVGFRVLAVTGTDSQVVIDIETTVELAAPRAGGRALKRRNARLWRFATWQSAE